MEESCPVVKNILLLDSEGKRVAVKYYTDDWDTLASKLAFEKSIFTKTQRTNARTEERRKEEKPACLQLYCVYSFFFDATLVTLSLRAAEIGMFDGYIIVYKFIADLHFFVTGGENENELILAAVLQGFFDAVSTLLRNNVEKRTALENLDLILLCIDEMVDGGIILETEPFAITGRVSTRSADVDAPLAEQTISQAFALAREHLARSLLN